MSDPTLSAMDFKNEMAWAWTTLKSQFSRLTLFQSFDFFLENIPFLIKSSFVSVNSRSALIISSKPCSITFKVNRSVEKC